MKIVDILPESKVVPDLAGTTKIDVLRELAAALADGRPEVAKDRLDVNTLAGTDSVSSAGLAAGAIQPFVDGLLVP